MNVTADGVTAALRGPDAAVEERLLARMRQRTDDLAKRSEQRRTDQPNRNTELETADAFLSSFNEMKTKLEQDLLKSDQLTSDRDAMMDHFNAMVRDHGFIQQFLNESSMFLASFQLKRSTQILAELNTQIQDQMEALQPKKRFGFKSKAATAAKPKVEKPQPSQEDDTDSKSADDSNSILDSILAGKFYGIKDKSDETIVMDEKEILNRQLNLQNLTNCTVHVLGNPGAIQIADLVDCTVIVGPTSRSAFVKRCRNCSFVMACQQVRIHNTSDSSFYLHVTGAAIIESCKNVGFAPYNLEYEKLDSHYELSGLDRSTNYWDKVEDFNWISKNEKSPNMFHMEEANRRLDWLKL